MKKARQPHDHKLKLCLAHSGGEGAKQTGGHLLIDPLVQVMKSDEFLKTKQNGLKKEHNESDRYVHHNCILSVLGSK